MLKLIIVFARHSSRTKGRRSTQTTSLRRQDDSALINSTHATFGAASASEREGVAGAPTGIEVAPMAQRSEVLVMQYHLDF